MQKKRGESVALPNWVSGVLSRRKFANKGDEHSPQQIVEVAAQLQTWAQQHTLIWVSPPFEKRFYQSMILDVDLPSGLFLIDELFPYEGSPDLLLNQHFSVEVRMQSMHASFKCLCTHVRKAPERSGERRRVGSPLVMRLPDVISQHQRRAGYRVDLNHIKDAYAKITLPIPDQVDEASQVAQISENLPTSPAALVEGQQVFPILDISSVGVAISVPAPVADNFPSALEGVLISVLDVMFEVSVIRRRTYSLPDGRCLVGLAFCDLQPAQSAKLERWILQLQRRLKRESRNHYAA